MRYPLLQTLVPNNYFPTRKESRKMQEVASNYTFLSVNKTESQLTPKLESLV